MQAAIGLEQLNKLEDMDSARRKNFTSLQRIFSKYNEFFMLPEKKEKSDPCWFGYLLTVKENNKFTKEDLVRYLEDHKIQTRSYFQ